MTPACELPGAADTISSPLVKCSHKHSRKCHAVNEAIHHHADDVSHRLTPEMRGVALPAALAEMSEIFSLAAAKWCQAVALKEIINGALSAPQYDKPPRAASTISACAPALWPSTSWQRASAQRCNAVTELPSTHVAHFRMPQNTIPAFMTSSCTSSAIRRAHR